MHDTAYQPIIPYAAFLERKAQLTAGDGFEPTVLPDWLFPFQRALVEWAVRQGRAALFADCGLGKTPMQLVWAENVRARTGRPVLIVTPLAVSFQTQIEARKFGLDAAVSRDGRVAAGITLTNYERLHLFRTEDYGGVVCDECFAQDTLIDTPTGRKRVQDVQLGDAIINAAGVDSVVDVHRREVPYAVKITAGEECIVSSPNHPYFTRRGWIAAQDLVPNDEIMATAAAVRMVRGTVHGAVRPGREEAVLQSILLSEMADEPAGAQSESTYPGSGAQTRRGEASMVRVRRSTGRSRAGAYPRSESDDQPRDSRESVPPIERDRPQTFRAWGQRTWFDDASVDLTGCTRADLDSGISFVVGSTDSPLSDGLQTRLGRARAANQYRSGWAIPSQPQGGRRQEGCQSAFARVDRLEVLEPGHPDLECLRDADGKLYFYDLGAARHPSFSVGGLLVHNSSAIKAFDGKRRALVTDFLRTHAYRLLCTATAAPNDYVELGTSSEALGHLGHTDMLGRFFTNDNKTRFMGRESAWRFKGHAETPFWRWVASWARALRRPSDLGFPDDGFALPSLDQRQHIVRARRPAPGRLFDLPATNLQEEREEMRRTLVERCEMVAGLLAGAESAIAWCQLNDEAEQVTRLIPGAVEVRGSDHPDAKEEALIAFGRGEIRVLVTKPTIAGWGLNWQHCHRMTFFPSHSYEQFYQAVRRCWRFGQQHPVTVDVVTTEGGENALASLERKAGQADRMFDALVAHMRDAAGIRRMTDYGARVEVPSWAS